MLITLQQLKTSLGAVKSYVDKILPKKVSDLDNDTGFITNEEISGKVDIEDLASVATSGDYDDLINKPTIPVVPVTDVQVNQTSVLSNGVANIPIASGTDFGVAKVNPTYGIGLYDGFLILNNATSQDIKSGNNSAKAVSAYRQHESTFYGLAKAAGVSMASSDNAVGTYTDAAKTAIKTMLGVTDPTVSDVQMNSTSIVSSGTATIPIADDQNKLGVVKVNNSYGITVGYTGQLSIFAALSADIKAGASNVRPITPGRLDEAVFYGLTKAAGVDMSSSSNTVGTYTANAKTAIQNMLGVSDDFVAKDSIDGAGISSRTYTTLIDETVITVSESAYLNPHAITVGTCNINKHYMHRITIGNDVYILPCQLWWLTKQDDTVKPFEYIGNIGLYTSDISYVPNAYYNVPFIIFNGGMNGICALDIMTQIAGEYHIKIEKIENTQVELPLSLVHGSAYYPIGVINGGENAVDGVSIGPNSISYGSFAFGVGNECLAGASFAFGQHNKSLEQMAFTEGFRNTASGVGSHAEGQDNIASGVLSHAEGQGNIASGAGSHAEGGGVTASGIQSHAENAITIASGDYSHSEGMMTTASGGNSHAEGQRTIASGQRSHAQGWRTIAQRRSQSVLGEANIADTYGENTSARGNYVEIVGNGTSDNARSNARTLDWNGNEYLNGNIYVNCNADSTGGQKLATENYVNSVAVISDVQINGTSILNNGVANIPKASTSSLGLITTTSSQGLNINYSSGTIYINDATSAQIKSADSEHKPVTTQRQHESVFYGLAKAAGDTTQSSSSNAVGAYTDDAKTAIKTMLGVPTDTYDLNDGTAITVNADLDTYTNVGIYHADSSVISTVTNSPTTTEEFKLVVESIGTNTIKQTLTTDGGRTCVRSGDNSTSSWVWGDWVSLITSVNYATSGTAGITRFSNTFGLYVDSSLPDFARIYPATADNIKSANSATNTDTHRPITPIRQHMSVFYGLAKAAGDTTQASSSNAVGTYTTEAKTAIKAMIGASDEIFIGSTTPSGYTLYIDTEGMIEDSEEVSY